MTIKKNLLLLIFFMLAQLSVADVNKTKNNESISNDTIIEDSIPGFSLYGNWCGPNHPKDVDNAPDPIDILDKQCKTHDLCYVDKGNYDCSCDRVMVKEIDKTQKYKLYSRQQYLLAQNIKIHFAVSPCNGEVEANKILPTRILTNIYKGTKRKVLNIYDRFSK